MTNPLKIYSGSNGLLYTTPINTGCRRRVQLMNEDSITVKFSDKTKMKFPVGTRIGYFYITKEQQEKYNATTGGYDYELKFDAYYWLWANRLLFYVMPGAANAPKETSFKLTATIDVHAAVILRCLNALGFTYDGSPFRVDTDEDFSTEAKYISYANMSILGGIQAIADAYECEWWVVGNSIHFGKCNALGEYDFTVGDNVASITSDSKETAPNRLIIFGSTRNLPSNYRTPESSDVVDAVVVKRLMLPEGIPYLQTSPDIPEDEIVEKEITLDSVYPRTALTVAEVQTYDSTADDGSKQTFYRLRYGNSFLFSKDYILPDEELHVVFESGNLHGMDFAVRFNPLGVGEKMDNGSFNPDAQMFEIVANEDYGRALPDAVLHPEAGDKFSLYGWDSTRMADLGLLAAAEQELLTEGNKLVDEYRKDKQTYTCPMMWDWCKSEAEKGNTPRLGSVVNLHFTAGDAGRKSRIIGYEHDLDIEYSNVTYICGEKVSVSRLKTLESKVDGLTHDGTKVRMQNSLDFLSKRYSDRTPYRLASDIAFEIGNYLAGVSGGIFGIDKASGKSFGEMDDLFVRCKAYFESLTVIEAETLAGRNYITPGSSVKCVAVRDSSGAVKHPAVVAVDAQGNELDDMNDSRAVAYRCFYLEEQAGEKTLTKIVPDDQAISRTFNAQAGSQGQVTNHYWWRLVTDVKNAAYTDPDTGNVYGYIEVSRADCDKPANQNEPNGSGGWLACDIPADGDVIAHLGNRTDKSRQTAIILDTVGADAPSIKMFGGIDGYTLADKAIISFGRDPLTDKVYFRLGTTNATQYLDYTQDGGLEIAGKLSVGSSIGDKTFEQWLQEHGYTDDSALDAFKQSYDSTITDIKSQIDGKAETWYQSTNPATTWTTAAAKSAHVGDLWYCTADIAGTNFKKDTTWYWDGTQWQQQNVPKSVFDAIDGKADIFVTKPTSYKANDLWFLESEYTLSGVKYPKGTLVVAIQDMGTAWKASDWTKKDNYTDDTTANKALTEISGYEYLKKALVDGKTTINGGLLMSSLIKLGLWKEDKSTMQTVYAGMNGVYGNPRTIASWWGGDMVDRFYDDKGNKRTTPLASGFASALVRMDGSAYFSNGNVGFEYDGSAWLGNENGLRVDKLGNITMGNGVTVNVSNVDGLQDTLNSLTNFNIGVTSLLTPYGVKEDGTIGEISWEDAFKPDPTDKTQIRAKSLKAKVGLWSNDFISSRGEDDQSGGGSLFGLYSDWAQTPSATDALAAPLGKELYSALAEAQTAISKLNTAVAGKAEATDLSEHTGNSTVHITDTERTKWNGMTPSTRKVTAGTGLTGGGALSSDVTLSLATSGVTAGTYAKVTVDVYGRVTKGASLAATDIPSLPWSKITSGKPTTLEGYGITDAYTKAESDGRFLGITATAKAAEKLAASVNIWGQSFDGSADVSGDMTGVGNITGTAAMKIVAAGRLTLNAGATALDLKFAGDDTKSVILNGSAFKPFDVASHKLTLGSTTAVWERIYGRYIDTDSGYDLRLCTAGTERVHINSSNGNVGIGTTSPSYLLHVNGTAKVTALVIGSITLTEVNGALHIDKGVYSDDFVSARGQDGSAGAGGSGGGLFGLNSTWGAVADKNSTDAFSDYAVWNGVDGIRAALDARITTNANSISSLNTNLSALSDALNTVKGNYVTVNTAQTIEGMKAFKGGLQIRFDVDTSRAFGISWRNVANDTTLMSIIGHNTAKRIIINPQGSAQTYNDTEGKYSLLIGVDELTYNTKKILHEGNYAGILDDRYVKKAGDTMSGALYFGSANCGIYNSGNQFVIKANDGVNKVVVNGTEMRRSGDISTLNLGNATYRWSTLYANAINVTSTALVANLNADMVDSKHVGNITGRIPIWTDFPTSTTLKSADYLASTYDPNGSTANEEYFKALLKWATATYSGAILLMGRATPNSQGLLHLVIYDTTKIQDGLPQHSYAVFHGYGGMVQRFGTNDYVWRWNYGRYYGSLIGNADTATKLATVRKIWGNDFNGSADVTGCLHITNDSVGSYTQGIRINQISSSSMSSIWLATSNASGYDAGMWGISATKTGNLRFRGGATAVADLMVITQAGNVGINTTSPAYKADVNGTFRASGAALFGSTVTASGLLSANGGAVIPSGKTLKIGDATITWDATAGALKCDKGIYSTDFISSRGNDSSAGGGSLFGLINKWPTTDPGANTTDALGANLGYALHTRVTALEGKNYLDALNLATTGSGNAVTAVALSTDKKTLTVTKGATFLTAHQSLDGYVKIGGDGVAEMGRYIDFHSADYGTNKTQDYTARIDAGSANVARVLALPNTSGTLALTSQLTNGSVTKVGTATVGSASRPVYLNGGVPTAGSYTFGNASGNAAVNNGTVNTNLNADLLDGVHNGSVTAKFLNHDDSSVWDCNNPAGTLHSDYGASGRSISNAPTGWDYGQLLTIWRGGLTTNALAAQFMFGVRHDNTANAPGYLWFRMKAGTNSKSPGWRSWGRLAFITDNVASATKLATARTVWGQSFDGSADVSGDMSSVGKIGFSNGREIGFNNSRFCFGTTSQGAANGVNVGSLLVSNAWADYTNVPTNGIYSKGVIRSGVATGTAPFTVASATLVSNLNADLLDGVHNGYLTANKINANSTPQGDHALTWFSGQATIGTAAGNAYKGSSTSQALWSFPDGGTAADSAAGGVANIMNLRLGWNSTYWADIFTSPNYERLWYRLVSNGSAKAWKQIAFTSDNVESANKLYTPRKINGTAFDGTADITTSAWGATRTLWGQSCNGSANISGTISNVKYITPDTAGSYAIGTTTLPFGHMYVHDRIHFLPTPAEVAEGTKNYTDKYTRGIFFGRVVYSSVTAPAGDPSAGQTVYALGMDICLERNNSQVGLLMRFTPEKRIGVHQAAPAYELDLSGTFRATGYVRANTGVIIGPASGANATLNIANSALHCNVGVYSDDFISSRGQDTTSDARMKTFVESVSVDLSKIAAAPLWRFRWKDTGRLDVGSVAQYWQDVEPLLVREQAGHLTLSYSKAALIASVTVARRLLEDEHRIREHGDRIRQLEARVAELEAQVASL